MSSADITAVRRPAVAGMFYPDAPAALATQVRACLDSAAPSGDAAARPKLLVVPHAGFVYSGAIAGIGYARLARWAGEITRVVLLGPVHRVAVCGLAVPTVTAFETPLGQVELDRSAIESLRGLPQVVHDDRPHAPEHSLEVQLPFLQTVLGRGFRLVPLAVGDASAADVAEVVERLWGGDETLIVVSSDLSHYMSYAQARAVDRLTVQRIVALDTNLDPHEACGARALNGALLAARRHGLRAELLDLRNSGDTAGDRSRVVGYASLALAPVPQAAGVDDDDEAVLGAALLSRARNAIRTRLGLPGETEPPHPALQQLGATFVTLHDARGALRGCIGALQAVRQLDEDVRHNAMAAAFADPRFMPLRHEEWVGLQVEVSLLEPAVALAPAATESDGLAQIEPGRDGLILEWRGYRATFLPQVWAQLPEPRDFMAALKRKAGLAADFWAADLRLSRYRVRSFE
jgi:MEMO1 family protein